VKISWATAATSRRAVTQRSLPRLAERRGIRFGSRGAGRDGRSAFTFNGTTHAVMMATPSDLEDFRGWFRAYRGADRGPRRNCQPRHVTTPLGIELRAWLPEGPVRKPMLPAAAVWRGRRAADSAASKASRKRRGRRPSSSMRAASIPRRSSRPWLRCRPDKDSIAKPVPFTPLAFGCRAGPHRRAGGCRPPQCARQTHRRARAGRGAGCAWHRASHEQVSIELIQKSARLGAPGRRRRVGADSGRDSSCGGLRHHACGDRARPGFRSLHTSSTHHRSSPASCRMTLPRLRN